jgi:NAD(P)H-flavin reductase
VRTALTVPIREVIEATPRARIVRLELGDRAFDYDAGQAVLIAPHGDPRRVPYSIASAPEDARRERMLELLVGADPTESPSSPSFVPIAGALVDVEGPVGAFTFPGRPDVRRFLFIAGGTGIAPLRAMLRHALVVPYDSIGVFYSARTPDDFAYENELRALADRGRIDLRQTITRSTAADWTGVRGRLTRDTLGDLVHDTATLCFVCGPTSLVDEVPRLLEAMGIARTRIRIEET